ncbi:MAG: hypothetical protein Q4P23_10015 [Micrococcaceae bacterium]|nr:hypothetical protein [Micrococcaceae bacterium]
MNPPGPNAFDLIFRVVGAAFVMIVLWVLIKFGRYAAKGSKSQESISSNAMDEDSGARSLAMAVLVQG